MFGA
ncbi:hypothetical protein SAMN03097705_3074 [[Enterobacter] aerogenes]|jgi:hypothetical protein